MIKSATCTVCGVPLVQRSTETVYKFRIRKTCCNAHRWSQIALTRRRRRTGNPNVPTMGLGAIQARIEPLRDWPVVPLFTDAATREFGRIGFPPAATVATGSAASSCADDMDAGRMLR